MELGFGLGLTSRVSSSTLNGGNSAGSWWLSGSILDADYSGGRFRYNGTSYADETALNTALGASKSGIARTIGPFVVGSELLADPGFASGVDSWADASTFAANGEPSQVSGALRLLFSGAGTVYRARRPITVTADRAYQLAANAVSHVTLTSAQLVGSTNIELGGTVAASYTVASLPQRQSLTIAPNTTTLYMGAILNGTAAATTRLDLDDASAKEVYPFDGYVPRTAFAKVVFTTPSSVPSAVVLTQWGDDSERQRIRIVLGTDFHLHLITTRNNSAVDDLDLGLLVASTEYTLNVNMALTHLLAQVVGFDVKLGTGTTLPGVGKIWIGRSFTGETWTGDIKRFTVWPYERIVRDAIWLEGDSYVAGSGGIGLTSSLVASGRVSITSGIGGTSIEEQHDRVVARPGLGQEGVFVHWDGSPSSAYTVEQAMTFYRNIVAELQHNRFLIIPPVRLSTANANNNTLATATQAAIAAEWPNNYIDAQAILASHATSPGDDPDVAGGYVPDSLLQADNTHLNSTGMGYIDAAVRAFLTAKGW